MARVFAFAVADDVANISAPNEKKVPALINPQAVLAPQYIPGMFSFGFTISIRDVDFSAPVSLRFEIQDPNGEPVRDAAKIEIPANAVPAQQGLPQEYKAITVNISVRNLPIKTEGLYHLVPYWNGTALEKQEIPIILRPDEPVLRNNDGE